MTASPIARRYAKALIELASAPGETQEWADQLGALQRTVQGNTDLRDVFENPIYVKEQRRAILVKLGQSLGLSPTVMNLLNLLVDRNRLPSLPAIVDAYRQMSDEKLGRLRATVRSAIPLDAAVAREIETSLAKATRREVVLDRKVDPAVIGGLVAEVGSVVYDGSVRTQLEGLRRALRE
jgi:F-type H+-transporting ATPase subunit delta